MSFPALGHYLQKENDPKSNPGVSSYFPPGLFTKKEKKMSIFSGSAKQRLTGVLKDDVTDVTKDAQANSSADHDAELLARLERLAANMENKEREQILDEEIKAAVNEEIGGRWVEKQPLWIRLIVQTYRFFAIFFAFYLFLLSLSMMGIGLTALTGKGAGQLFVDIESPIVGLMIGVLATVLVQSSSTVTSIIVVLVANNVVPVTGAVYMIFGSNIGTSVTNTIVALGFADDKLAYERGFAGATVHDMFNLMNVMLFLWIEVTWAALISKEGHGFLQTLAESITESRGGVSSGSSGAASVNDVNPIKIIVNPILLRFIDVNKNVISDYAKGFPPVPTGDALTNCDVSFHFLAVSPEDCVELESGGVQCDFCPDGIFNQTIYDQAKAAFDSEEVISGGVLQPLGDQKGGAICLIVSLLMLIAAIFIIVRLLTIVLLQAGAKKMLVRSINFNFVGGHYFSIFVGFAITIIIQSSSITTSILTPLVAIDALKLENMFPLTLGANIGTTGTGLLAAVAAGETNGYTIALVHFFFNFLGVLFWYPIPMIRNIPLGAARFLGNMAYLWRIFPIIYILILFIIYPLIIFGVASAMRGQQLLGAIVGGFSIFALIAVMGYSAFWYSRRQDKNKFLGHVMNHRIQMGDKYSTILEEGEEIPLSSADLPLSR